MFFLQYSLFPDDTHPEREQLGESLVLCWVERKTLAEADRVARRHLRRERWRVVEREHGEPTSEADCPREEWVEYHRQAVIDKEVYVFHVSPRYPVLCVTVPVTRGCPAELAEAHYYVSGESMAGDGEDVSAPGFWSAERVRQAEAEAVEFVTAEGWTVAANARHRPCGRSDLPEEFHGYYDEAEDQGNCLVFVHEGGGEGEPG